MQTSDRATELAGALQARLSDLRAPVTAGTEHELKRLVCEYADVLKALGFPAERVILAVKRAANQAGLRSSSLLPQSTVQLSGEDRVLADMVRWCIERYYGTPPRAD